MGPDGGLRPALLGAVLLARPGQYRDEHQVRGAQYPDGLDGDQLGIAWPDTDPDQPSHRAAPAAAVNLAANAGWPAQCKCR